jgi:hypothetical protein
MAAKPKKVSIKFGTAAGKLKYKDSHLEVSDTHIQNMFYAND